MYFPRRDETSLKYEKIKGKVKRKADQIVGIAAYDRVEKRHPILMAMMHSSRM